MKISKRWCDPLTIMAFTLVIGMFTSETMATTAGNSNWLRGIDHSNLAINNTIFAVVQKGPNIYVAGSFTSIDGVSANRIAKWNGTIWSAMGTGMNANVNVLAVDKNDNVYAGGEFTTAGGATVNRIAKWNGNSWKALGTGLNDTVFALAIDNKNNVYVGGSFTAAGVTAVNRIAKWNGTWNALGAGMTTAGSSVNALAINSSGNLYAGGSFTAAGAVVANRVALWNGTAWSALSVTGMNNTVSTLTYVSGNLYAGGLFTTAGSSSSNYIAKWNGTAWRELGTGISRGTGYQVYALQSDSSGSIYVGGKFDSAGGIATNNIAKWDGSAWSALGDGLDESARGLSLDSNGDLMVGGAFTTAGGKITPYLARWLLVDTDNDTVGDVEDNCSAMSNTDQLNTDGDTKGDACDGDDDNDGVADASDAFPLDPTETLDNDNDGTGNNADTDDDNDTVLDVADNCPLNANLDQLDTDSDAQGNACDTDDDNDTVPDANDAFPLDATETLDNDSDGTGNNADTDDDNDTVLDVLDNCPLNTNTDQLDTDANGFGDVCDFYTQNGAAANNNLGSAIAIADMNNDGYDDVIVGAPGKKLSKTQKRAGQITILSGSDGSILKTFTGKNAEDRFGSAIAVVEDKNSDGVPDLIIGSPLYDVSATKIDAGKVELYSGANGVLLRLVVTGSKSGDQLGASVAVADIDNDGNPNLVIGIPGRDLVGLKDAGQVKVYAGINSTLLYQRNGTQIGEQLGAAVAVDKNLLQLFVGSPFFDANNGALLANAGRVTVFDGADGVSAALFTVDGTVADNHFGSAVVSFSEDLDGDTFNDWAVGSSFADPSANVDAGIVDVFSGFNATAISTIDGATAGDNFGAALATGDINNDGENDLAIGSPKFDVPLKVDAGSVEAISGAMF